MTIQVKSSHGVFTGARAHHPLERSSFRQYWPQRYMTNGPLSIEPNCKRIILKDLLILRGVRVFYRRVLIVSAFVAASVSLAAARDLALVANKANTVSAITLPELVKLCKAQATHWPDGRPVTFIMRSPSTPEMKMLLEKVFELPEDQVRELVSTANHGRAGHPAIVIAESDEDLVNKVASLPGAVGVVDVYAINSSVAVVKVGGKLPLEPGYLLHGN